MDLQTFRKDIQSPLWFEAHDYIVNNKGEPANLEPLVRQLSVEVQSEVVEVLHNLLLVGFCAEHISRVKRTCEILEHLYQNPDLVAVCNQSPPTQFRWGNWISQVCQRQKSNKKTCPPTLEPGVGAFLLTYAHCLPPLLKGTLNAMAEEDGTPLQWGRSFGMPGHIDRWNEKTLQKIVPDIHQRLEQWNSRVQRDVLLQEALEKNLENNEAVPRVRKM